VITHKALIESELLLYDLLKDYIGEYCTEVYLPNFVLEHPEVIV